MRLTIDNVSYVYPKSKKTTLHKVNCQFDSGKLYAIMGASGSGKSTFLSLLAGLDYPTEGDIRIGEKSLRQMDLDLYRRENIAMIFQSFHLLPLLTVIENVCYPMTLNGVDVKSACVEAENILLGVGISHDQMNRFPSKLSGGEQQRVAIARSLASGASILFADEPTGNLDTENTIHIMKILKSLAQEKGYCVVVVTHEPAVATYADHVYTMSNGCLNLQSDNLT